MLPNAHLMRINRYLVNVIIVTGAASGSRYIVGNKLNKVLDLK